MNQSDSSARRWWQGWFGVWHFSGEDSRYAIVASVWTAVFSVLFAAGIVVLEPGPGDYRQMPLWQWVLALAPVIPGLVAIAAWRRLLNRVEELYKKLVHEAAATAFAITLLAFLALGIVGNILGDDSDIEWTAILFCLMLLTFIVNLNAKIRGFNA